MNVSVNGKIYEKIIFAQKIIENNVGAVLTSAPK